MGSSDGDGLLMYIYSLLMLIRIFMPQNGQVAVLKCSAIWKKMRKNFKTLSDLIKLKFLPKAWKREAMVHKTPPPLKVIH